MPVATSTLGIGGSAASSSPTYGTVTATSGTSSLANLSVPGTTRLGTLTGLLKAVSGYVTTALVNLASDVQGVLGTANGGTGTSSPQGFLFGNGSIVSTSTIAQNFIDPAIARLSDLTGYLTLTSWYATTTDALDEGTTNRYFTDARVGSYISGSSTVPHVGGTAFGDLLYWTGSGWGRVATSSLGLMATADGTFSTTSADFWDSTKSRWATTSAAYFLSINQGAAFSTTSANYWDTTKTRWATTSADYHLSTKSTSNLAEGSNLYFTNARVLAYLDSLAKGYFFSTTSTSHFLGLNQGAAFSTTSAAYWETQQTARTADDLSNNTTSDLSEGTRLYYTDARVGSYITGSTTLPGFLNYWTKNGTTLSYSGGITATNATTTNATSTNLAVTKLCLSTDCRTAWPIGGSGSGLSTTSAAYYTLFNSIFPYRSGSYYQSASSTASSTAKFNLVNLSDASRTALWIKLGSGTMAFSDNAMHLTTASGADIEAIKTFWTSILQDMDTISFEVNFNGYTFVQAGDTPRIGFEQGGDKYVLLHNFATNGATGWQKVTIPLSKFTSNGDATPSTAGTGTALSPNTAVTNFKVRVWNDTAGETVSIRNVVVSDSTGTVVQDFTQPDLLNQPKPGNSAFRVQGIDLMKVSKDNMSSQYTSTQMDSVIRAVKPLNPTHIAISTIYNENPNDYPNDDPATGYSQRWSDAVRKGGYNVIWRQTPLGWEDDLYGVAKNNTAGIGSATGTLSGVETNTYLAQIYNYIVAHPDQYAPGDIFVPIPEPENGGINGVTTCYGPCQFADANQFRRWLRDAITVSNVAFDRIGLKGRVFVGLYGNSAFIIGGNVGNPNGFLDDRTVEAMRIIGMDDYPNPASEIATDLSDIELTYGKFPMILTEWGTINETSTTTKAAAVDTVMEILKGKPYIHGVNYWTAINGANENILHSNLTPSGGFEALQKQFTSGSPSLIATALGTGFGNLPILVASGTPPLAGQVLTAVSPTLANWVAPSTGGFSTTSTNYLLSTYTGNLTAAKLNVSGTATTSGLVINAGPAPVIDTGESLLHISVSNGGGGDAMFQTTNPSATMAFLDSAGAVQLNLNSFQDKLESDYRLQISSTGLNTFAGGLQSTFLTAYGSSTIGAGTPGNGLTISGTATTTGTSTFQRTATFAERVGIATTTTAFPLTVAANSGGGSNNPIASIQSFVDRMGLWIRHRDGAATSEPLFKVTGDNTGDKAFQFGLDTDSAMRFNATVTGFFEWGSGSAGRDTNLYRVTADTLGTDDTFTAATRLGVGTTTPRSKLHVSSGASATTTVDWGDPVSTSKVCHNTKNTVGTEISFYFAGTTMVVETGRCK